jgi:hypothetical protein
MKILKSIGAVLAGLVFIIFTHTLTDTILESAGIFPPADQGLHVTWMLVFALFYRIVLSIIGCFITAKLAPSNPMKHCVDTGTDRRFREHRRSGIWYPDGPLRHVVPDRSRTRLDAVRMAGRPTRGAKC